MTVVAKSDDRSGQTYLERHRNPWEIICHTQVPLSASSGFAQPGESPIDDLSLTAALAGRNILCLLVVFQINKHIM
jgi:hypothetical protein